MVQTLTFSKANGSDVVTFPTGTKMVITLKGARGGDNGTKAYGGKGGAVQFRYTSDGTPLTFITNTTTRATARVLKGSEILAVAGGGGSAGNGTNSGSGGDGGRRFMDFLGRLGNVAAGSAGDSAGDASGGNGGTATSNYVINGSVSGSQYPGSGGFGYTVGQGGSSRISGVFGAGGGGGGSSYIYDVSALTDTSFPTHNEGYSIITVEVQNETPTLTLNTSEAQTLYENDILAINGSVTDADTGNIVSVKYSIDGGATKAIIANVSSGNAISYAKNLTYKAGMLYDGATAVTSTLAEGSQHTLKVWAEDDQGGKSTEITRSFYVVPNRAATLTLDAFVTRTGLINTDVVNISGKVADLDNGNVIVKYKIGNGAFVQVFNNTVGATPTPFNFNVLLADLVEGDNQITIQAVDAYNAITQQVLTIRKNKNEVPMLEAVTYYEITPPNGTSDGLQLYIEREVGDLIVAADVFMGAPEQSEVFVPMTLASTANLTNGNAEDTFSYEHGSDASKIVVRIKMTRSSGSSNKAIKKISGVLT